MKCNGVDYFDDMYPEFAPDPIRVECDDEPTFVVFWRGPAYDGGGYPIPRTFECSNETVCDRHLCDVFAYDEVPEQTFPDCEPTTIVRVKVIG